MIWYNDGDDDDDDDDDDQDKVIFSAQCHTSDGFQPDVAQDGSLTRYRIEGFFLWKKTFHTDFI